MGRPPKPTEQKRRLGNPGKRALPAPLVVLPPADLGQARDDHRDSPASLELLDNLIQSGAAVWIGQTDVAMVEVARQTWVDWQKARELWLALPMDKDLAQVYNDMTKRLTTCLSQLGLDPTARARLGVAEVKQRTALDAIEEKRRRRKAGRRAG